ncbi:MAG: molecular chaperone DnaJ [Candidatus Omnitrophica bacterium]|nr:molecular chaperone DnaJ [Candidatus Omnitrophota bacterium]
MSKHDYYEILGIGKNASAEEIKRAYRKLAIKSHPDKHQGDKAAEERFKEISEAYEILSDPQKRATYDQFGHEGLKGAFAPSGFQWQDFTHFGDFSDIFGGLDDFFESFGIDTDLFGFGRRRRRTGPHRGASLQYELEIDLKEAAFGTEKTINVQRLETCNVCHGKGAKPGTKEATCDACSGKGQVSTVSGFFSILRTCERCGGRGTIIKTPCTKCNGTGRTRAARRIKVHVPRGIDNETRLRISGEGEAGERGGQRGDLYVLIYVKEHDIFERHYDDIYCRVPISFITAVFGGEIEVPTLESSVKMKIPEGTQSGRTFRLKQKGIYHLSKPGRGDELCKVMVETPTNLNIEQKRKLKEFAIACGEDVQPKTKGFMDRVKKAFK